ncbi:MAG: UDP-N-acetylmuramoyl-L-alanine--D-glutamate ligase [Pseudomonadota bacterium]
MIVATGYQGKKVAVLGLGRSGLSAARALEAGGAEVTCWDDSSPARERAEGLGLAIADPRKDGRLDHLACLVTSPGIPHLYPAPHPIIAAAMAAAVPVDNDIGLFFRSFAAEGWEKFETVPRIVAVTGSNGKSTTASLIHHVLDASGRRAQLAGNIGRGVFDLESAEDGEVVVLELSSYQTELARALTPDVAVFTNLSPDHLDRHGGMGGYFAAKRRLFVEGGPDRAVIGVDEMEGRYLAAELTVGRADDRVIRVSGSKIDGPGWSVTARKGYLSEMRKGRQVASVDLRAIAALPGAHNHQNACAAYAACRSLGLAPRDIEAGFKSFAGLPHRSQIVAEADGVSYVNDSKATNVDSAAKALQAFTRIRWICGGLMKEGGLAGLHAHLGTVERAYVIGREAETFALDLPGVDTVIAGTMAEAVAQAVADAKAGDTVLLAPAAASFDQYDSFETRGADFIAEVERHVTRRGL